ncbi:hemin uptake protein HemP [Thiorhodococcus minor]|uniref:Hemin uptake protein HemP n=1 Tax=Thiorhodococcus minor TaxID=57489 RepID=A0A6M0JX18_9GAMM|nr:hemin uptake protein HemP [Thiorhodococcus minor]NEV60857.1 hemin uptake protein HemP [Thiorhodococcus minor]
MISTQRPLHGRQQGARKDRPETAAPKRIDSKALMAGHNLLMIEHMGSHYYLRMTRNNKLILTK